MLLVGFCGANSAGMLPVISTCGPFAHDERIVSRDEHAVLAVHQGRAPAGDLVGAARARPGHDPEEPEHSAREHDHAGDRPPRVIKCRSPHPA